MDSRIKHTLQQAIPGLKELKDEFYVIGSAALSMLGMSLPDVKDIDILTSTADSELLKDIWKDKYIEVPDLDKTTKFRSSFARFHFPDMEVEALGDLELQVDDEWLPLKVNEYIPISVDGYSIKVPTLQEMIRILHLFGREKDYRRIELIRQYSRNIILEN